MKIILKLFIENLIQVSNLKNRSDYENIDFINLKVKNLNYDFVKFVKFEIHIIKDLIL